MIFPWLYRVLPGNKLAKLLQIVLLCGLVATALMLWVFPALDAQLSIPTVETSSAVSKSISLILAREGITL